MVACIPKTSLRSDYRGSLRPRLPCATHLNQQGKPDGIAQYIKRSRVSASIFLVFVDRVGARIGVAPCALQSTCARIS